MWRLGLEQVHTTGSRQQVAGWTYLCARPQDMVSAQATVTGCGNKTSLHVLIQSYWMNPPFNKAVRFRHISQTIRRAMKGASVFLESWIAGQELTDEQKSKLNDQQKAAAEMPTRTKKCQLSNTRDSI